jgi:hypothetical protein
MSSDTKPEEVLGGVKAEVLHVEEHNCQELESTYIPDPIAESKLVRKVRDPIIGCHSHRLADGFVTGSTVPDRRPSTSHFVVHV